MKRMALLVLSPLPPGHAAFAETPAGNKALTLAALIAGHSPHIGAEDKRIMIGMLEGNPNFRFPPTGGSPFSPIESAAALAMQTSRSMRVS